MTGVVGMNTHEAAGWSAFTELEPFGPAREDLRAAYAATIPAAAMNGSRLMPADLFSNLGAEREPAADRKHVGRGFRLWGLHQAAHPQPGGADR